MTGLEIRIERIMKRIKSYELANMVNVNPSIISMIENGRMIPDDELLEKIKKALEIQ